MQNYNRDIRDEPEYTRSAENEHRQEDETQSYQNYRPQQQQRPQQPEYPQRSQQPGQQRLQQPDYLQRPQSSQSEYQRPHQPERDHEAEREQRAALLARFRLGIYYVAHLFAIVIGFRFILLALGANLDNQFANFIYSVSYPLVTPFLTLFGQGVPQYGNIVIEVSDLFAIGVYYLLAWGLVRAMYLFFAPSDEVRRT
jgi:YggT family protein